MGVWVRGGKGSGFGGFRVGGLGAMGVWIFVGVQVTSVQRLG